MKVVGIRKVEYTSKKTGQPVHGWELHVVESGVKGMLGDRVQQLWVRPDVFGALLAYSGSEPEKLLNKDVDVFYNQYGSVSSVGLKGGERK